LVNPKKELITTKITSKIDKNKKEVYTIRKEKSTSSNIKSSKTLNKNYYINLMKEIPPGGQKLTDSLTLNVVSLNDHQDKNNNSIKRKPIISNNKNDEKIIAVNNKSKNSDNSKNKAGLKNSRNIRINTIIKTGL
jgi:hypothetical protein